jgi:flagellar hook-associated protein 2
MSLISSVGITSGINFDELVSKLMELERVPLLRLQGRINDYEQKISSLGTLASALSSLKDAVSELKNTELIGRNATSSDESVFTATATEDATVATYAIKINRIAQAQSLYSTVFSSDTDPVADLSQSSIQKIQIQVGSSTPVTITVDSSNNTLSGIRDAINSSGAPVRASIVNDGTGYRLIITSNNTGASNTIQILIDEDNNGVFEETAETDSLGLSRLAFNPDSYDSNGTPVGGVQQMSQSMQAADAELVVDGLTVTRASNTISDLITGVTITLKKDSSGSTLSLTISENTEVLKNKLNSFISAYNQVFNTIKNLKGDFTRKGPLYGVSLTNRIMNTLREITINSYNGKTLASLGITHDRSGVLQMDSSTLDTALSEDSDSVINTINEMANSVYSVLDEYISTIIPNKREGFESSKRYLLNRRDSLERRLELIEDSLRKRFYLLEQTLSQLQSESNYVTQQLSNISRITGDQK